MTAQLPTIPRDGYPYKSVAHYGAKKQSTKMFLFIVHERGIWPGLPLGLYKLPPRTVVLPHWLTPAFCRRALKEKNVGGGQVARYKAIAKRCDWGIVKNGDKKTKRNWPLVWLEPPRDENGDPDPVERERAPLRFSQSGSQ